MAALIEGDKRIRVVVREQIYTRIVEFTHHSSEFRHQSLSEGQKAALTGVYTKEFSHGGKSLEAWIVGKLVGIGLSATHPRSFFAQFRFREPIRVDVRGIDLSVEEIDIRGGFSVQWMTQLAEIGASQGMYDYLREAVLFGPGQYQYHVKNINSQDWGTPIDVDEVPPHLLIPADSRPFLKTPSMEFTMFKNLPQSDPKDAPDLDPLIGRAQIIDEVQNGEEPEK
jgi:hypothetical protein